VSNFLLKTKRQKECRNGVNKNVKNPYIKKNVKMLSKEILNILVSKIYRKKSQNQHHVLVVLVNDIGRDIRTA
jgi:hypothetical protein